MTGNAYKEDKAPLEKQNKTMVCRYKCDSKAKFIKNVKESVY